MHVHFINPVHINGQARRWISGDNVNYACNTWRGDGILITFEEERIFIPHTNVAYVKESRL